MRLPRMTTWRWMIIVAVVGFVFCPFLEAYKFIKNPYCNDPWSLRLMRDTKYRMKMADAHSKKAARSVGKQAEFHATMGAKWKEAAYNHVCPVEPDPPPPEP